MGMAWATQKKTFWEVGLDSVLVTMVTFPNNKTLLKNLGVKSRGE